MKTNFDDNQPLIDSLGDRWMIVVCIRWVQFPVFHTHQHRLTRSLVAPKLSVVPLMCVCLEDVREIITVNKPNNSAP